MGTYWFGVLRCLHRLRDMSCRKKLIYPFWVQQDVCSTRLCTVSETKVDVEWIWIKTNIATKHVQLQFFFMTTNAEKTTPVRLYHHLHIPVALKINKIKNKLTMLLKIHFTQCFWVALTSLPPSLSFPLFLPPAQSVCVQRVFSRAQPACVAVGPAVRALPSRVPLPHPALWKLPLPRSDHQVGVNFITSPRLIQFSPWLCNVVYKWGILCRQKTWRFLLAIDRH